MILPEDFKIRMQAQLGDEAEEFFMAIATAPPTSIRLNHRKGKSSYPGLEKVPWCDSGFYLDQRPPFHLDPHWHGGAYYVQEASSMILDNVIHQLSLDDKPKIWLDVCAAPGGKTGILAKHMKASDVLVANEVVPQRRSVLRENLYKAGFLNTFITGEQASAFNEPFADIILVDAPCAGEGMMRKEPVAIRQWSPELVRNCSMMQQKIVTDTVKALNVNGYLIYSTCSYSNEENLENVKRFVESFSLTSISLQFPHEWGIKHLESNGISGYQLFPHKVKGEGIFISVLKREGNKSQSAWTKKILSHFITLPDWLKRNVKNADGLLTQRNKMHYPLIKTEAEEKANIIIQRFQRVELLGEAGELKGRDFIPSHYLAMAGLSSGFKMIELGLDHCLDYLERDIKTLPPNTVEGWYLISFEGTIIGWAKKTNQGWKNHYPLHWRLRSRKT